MAMVELDRKKEIKENLEKIQRNVRKACEDYGRNVREISIMAVTKTVSAQDVNLAIDQGITLLGENRAQELIEKYDQYRLKKNNIHFIGHLQTNKIKYIIDKVSLIESVDSIRLAKAIDTHAHKQNIVMDILLEINIGNQISKSGFSVDEIDEALQEIGACQNIKVKGLMTIPPVENAKQHFKKMLALFSDIKDRQIKNIDMQYLSMGMSGDYIEAIMHGANIIRIGSALFGSRN